MMPLWLSIPALVVAGLVGLALERASGNTSALSDRSPLAWVTRVLSGLASFVALVVHPALGVALVLCFVWHVRRLREGGQLERAPKEPLPWTALAVVAVLVLVVLARPAVPLAWDEQAWLAGARIACSGPWALTTRALDPGGDLLPSGHAIGPPVLGAALALFRPDLGSLTAGAAALVLVSALAFALVLVRAGGTFRPAVISVLLGAPLAWAHLRTGGIDLPLGLFSATFGLALLSAARGDERHAALAPALACLLAALDDEGALHVCAVAVGLALFSPDASRLRRHALASAASALVVVAVWRARLALGGVEAEHHALTGLALDALPALLRELARAGADMGSFGASLALVLAASVASLARPRGTRSGALALGLALVVLGALGARVLGPEPVRQLALEGTVFARLLVQVLPLGALVVGVAIHERDERGAPAVETPRAQPPPRALPTSRAQSHADAHDAPNL